MDKFTKEIVFLPIDHCSKCPNKIEDNHQSTDGWDRMEDWRCKLVKDGDSFKKIAGAVEWHEERKIKIPEWCPLSAFRIVLVADENEKGFTSFYKNFPLVISQGETEDEAICNLSNSLHDIVKYFTNGTDNK